MGTLLYADSLPKKPQQIQQPNTAYHTRPYGIQAPFNDLSPDLQH